MNTFDLELLKIQYDESVRGLKNRKDLTMEQAVEALDLYCACLLQSLVLHSEESLQHKAANSGWFVYKYSRDENPLQSRVNIRTTDQTPVHEIEVFSTAHESDDPEEVGHRVIIRNNEIIPGVYHENLPIISIPMSEVAEGIVPDGEWVSTTEDGVTVFKQYPWQARAHRGSLLIETSPRYFTQTERRYSEGKSGTIGYSLFWNGQYENNQAVPSWNHRFAANYFKQMRDYAAIFRSVLFGKEA